MDLFIFFALPLATILLAIVFQKILRYPILVAILFFAIYLIVAFSVFADTLAEALIAVIIYTIIAYITAIIVNIICRCKKRFINTENNRNIEKRNCACRENDNENNNENNLLRISCSCGNSDVQNDLLTIDSTCLGNNQNIRENSRNEILVRDNFESNIQSNTQNYYTNPVINKNVIRRNCYRR